MEGRKESNTHEDPERKNSRIGSEDQNIALSKITIPAHLKKDERLQTVDLKSVEHSGEAGMSTWEGKVDAHKVNDGAVTGEFPGTASQRRPGPGCSPRP